jgi:hypothetical protein
MTIILVNVILVSVQIKQAVFVYINEVRTVIFVIV